MASLLLNERPLVVLPGLAEALGSVDEAIILQQINYWLQKSTKIHDGKRWVYNTMEDWMKQFPWIKSRTTLKKYFNNLKKRGLVVTGRFNKQRFDKTTWYSIDFSKLQKFTEEFEKSKQPTESTEINAGQSIGQGLANGRPENGQSEGQELANQNGQNLANQYHRLPETTSETTTENNMSDSKSDESIPFKEIIEYLNEKTDNSYKPSAEGHKKFIRPRWNEGNTLDDFKTVIDYKVNEWMGTKMEMYLRPKTLFSNENFDNYLSEAKKKLKRDGQENSLFANQWHPQNDDDLPF